VTASLVAERTTVSLPTDTDTQRR